MNTSPQKANRTRTLLTAIGALASKGMSRVKAARIKILQTLGKVPEGSSSYNRLCPRGAGAGPKKHSIDERDSVGARKFHRKAKYLLRHYNYKASKVSE